MAKSRKTSPAPEAQPEEQPFTPIMDKILPTQTLYSRSPRRMYRITTDRGPFWGGEPQPENAIIQVSPEDAVSIELLTSRGWAVEVRGMP